MIPQFDLNEKNSALRVTSFKLAIKFSNGRHISGVWVVLKIASGFSYFRAFRFSLWRKASKLKCNVNVLMFNVN